MTELLPDIRIVGPLRNDEALQGQLSDHLKYQHEFADVERSHSPEFDVGLNGIFDATKEYLQAELGIDTGDRMPQTSNIHLLTRDDMYKHLPSLEDDDVKKLDVYGSALGRYNIVVREPADSSELPLILHVVQHECVTRPLSYWL